MAYCLDTNAVYFERHKIMVKDSKNKKNTLTFVYGNSISNGAHTLIKKQCEAMCSGEAKLFWHVSNICILDGKITECPQSIHWQFKILHTKSGKYIHNLAHSAMWLVSIIVSQGKQDCNKVCAVLSI